MVKAGMMQNIAARSVSSSTSSSSSSSSAVDRNLGPAESLSVLDSL